MLNLKENIPLAPLTTLGIGGQAKHFIEAKTVSDISEVLYFARHEALPVFILGGGSNVLISDEGFNGLVIHNAISGFKEEKKEGDFIYIRAGAGENWDEFVDAMVKKGYSGIECLSAIPGSVGAAPVQNIGAYGQEASQTVAGVKVIDLENGDIKDLSNPECGFGYRRSIFNNGSRGRYTILEVVFRFKVAGDPSFEYQDLKAYFADSPKPTLAAVRAAVIEIRTRKGFAMGKGIEAYKSAGSFFKNPVVPNEVFEKAKNIMKDGDGKWYWAQPDGRVKVSAARLIESAGFPRGYKMGNAGISPKHSLSLINLGGAKAGEIIELAKQIIGAVKEKFGISIEPEVQLVGFKNDPFKQ